MTIRPEQPTERSSVVVIGAVLVVVVATAALVVANIGGRMVARERANATADAVVLAGVTGGRDAALEVAAANEAEVSSLDQLGAISVVRIVRSGLTATAAAQPSPL